MRARVEATVDSRSAIARAVAPIRFARARAAKQVEAHCSLPSLLLAIAAMAKCGAALLAVFIAVAVSALAGRVGIQFAIARVAYSIEVAMARLVFGPGAVNAALLARRFAASAVWIRHGSFPTDLRKGTPAVAVHTFP